MIIKKNLARVFLTVGLMAFSLAPVYAFEDVSENSTNDKAIQYLAEKEVVKGYEDGSYKPYNAINRAEFTKIIIEAAGVEESGANCFPDVKEDWFAPYVCKAKELGYIDGYSDGLFRPGQSINFVEASKILANVFELQSDKSEVGQQWYDEYVWALENNKAIPGNVYDFGQPVTRGVMAEMVWRVLAKPENIVSSTYSDLKANKLNVDPEYFVPVDASMVWKLNYEDNEKTRNFEGLMNKFPAIKEIMTEPVEGQDDFDKTLSGVMDFSGQIILALGEFDMLTNQEPSMLFIVKSDDAQLMEDLLKDVSLDAPDLVYEANGGNATWTSTSTDFYAVRNHNLFMFSNDQATMDEVKAKMKLGNDYLNIQNTENFKHLSADPFMYLYVSQELVEDATMASMMGLSMEDVGGVMVEVVPEPDALRLLAYSKAPSAGDIKGEFDLFKMLPKDGLLGFYESNPVPELGDVLVAFYNTSRSEDVSEITWTEAELRTLAASDMMLGLYRGSNADEEVQAMAALDLGTANLALGEKLVKMIAQSLTGTMLIDEQTGEAVVAIPAPTPVVKDGYKLAYMHTENAESILVGVTNDGFVKIVYGLNLNDPVKSAIKLDPSFVQTALSGGNAYDFGFVDFKAIAPMVSEMMETPDSEAVSNLSVLDTLIMSTERVNPNLDKGELILKFK